MKLLETYSRNCSVNIKNKPSLYQKFFPLGDLNKFITIQNKSGMSAKDYSYFQEVVDLLTPILNKEGIKIILLGQDAPPLNNVINLSNQTSIGQAAFIIKKSLLHLSVDSWSCHYAGAEDVPLVALYGSTTVENHAPYHYNPDKSIFLESHRNGLKASFQREENSKMVDLIKPEEIAAAVCKLLNLSFSYPYKTLEIGKFFNNRILESDCSNVLNLQQIGINSIVMRLDYQKVPNYAVLMGQLQISKVSIVCSEPIPLNILQQYRQNIIEICYKIDSNHNPLFVKELMDNKIPVRLFSELPINQLNPIKLEYLDLPLIVHRGEPKMPDFLKDKNLANIYYKCAKNIISSGVFFQSLYDVKIKRQFNPNDPQPQNISNLEFLGNLWTEQDYCIFLEKT